MDEISNENIQELINACLDAKKFSYSPYSNFPVGAALLCGDGTIIQGCNVENSSYPVGVCAEKTAIVSAVSRGKKTFRAIALTTNIKESFAFPCGECRQTLVEFNPNMKLYSVKPDRSFIIETIANLIPNYFGPADLKKASSQ